MKADALRLDQTARILSHETDVGLKPDDLDKLVADRPSRLAVDPKAMAVSCALLAGYQARTSGLPDLAAEMFGLVVANYSVDRYGYYVGRAKDGLESLARGKRLLPQEPVSEDPGS